MFVYLLIYLLNMFLKKFLAGMYFHYTVMLQPLEGTSTGDRTKHKFMVQTMFAPQGFQLENLDIVVSIELVCHKP